MPSGYSDYNPLVAKFPMSWPPDRCNWCQEGEIVWAYPLGQVKFSRRIPPDGVETVIPHHTQQWFACARCKEFIDKDRLTELAELLGKPSLYFMPLKEARLKSDGFPWRRPKPRP